MTKPALVLLIMMAGLLFVAQASGTWRDNLALNGYVRASPTAWKTPSYLGGGTAWNVADLIHTRENLRCYGWNRLTLDFELKTRLIHGDVVRQLLGQATQTARGGSYFNWERTFVDEEHVVLTSEVDRLSADWTSGPLEVTLGRQRIAWGTNLVWNPIDLFNPSSPLDFDNEEKPGTDAARVQLYVAPASRLEMAVAPQREADRTTAAATAVFNKWSYDWVFVAGRRGAETVGGLAWAGNIRGGGFRGEVLCAVPRQSGPHSDSYVVVAVDGDYTFSSSLYLHGSVLYNGLGTTGDAGGPRLLEALQAGELSPGRMSLLAEVGRQLSPLTRVGLSGILNPYDLSSYLGPTFTWSVLTNLDMTAMGLVFGGGGSTEFGGDGGIVMARIKYSF
jgi:hypothetical protein